MNDNLLKAILAMDSYNRGYGAGLDLRLRDENGQFIPGENGQPIASDTTDIKIGTAEIIFGSGELGVGIDQSANFYAIAYKFPGADGAPDSAVVSYRGTDDPLGSSDLWFDGDIWTGWTVGGGSVWSQQAELAFKFYGAVATSLTIVGDPVSFQDAPISLTGHSLGGGLAGLVGSIYGKDGVLFANMPFELVTANTIEITHDAMHDLYNPTLRDIIYGPVIPWGSNASGLSGYAVEGETLTSFRAGQNMPVETLTLGPNVDLPGTIPLYDEAKARHSMATHVISLFATVGEVESTDWQAAAQYFWPAMYDNNFAATMGMTSPLVSGVMQSNSNHSGILRTLIAYSAINEGERLFGDTAIRSFYHDANELGQAITASDTLLFHVDGLSKTFIQYAGLLALNKILANEHPETLEGVLSFSVPDNLISVDFRDSVWGDLVVGNLFFNMPGRDALFNQAIAATGNETAVRTAIETYWGGNNPSNLIEYAAVSMTQNGSVVLPEVDELSFKAMLYVGTLERDAVIGSSGRDLLLTYSGNDTVFAGAGHDMVDAGSGANIVMGGAGNDVFLSSHNGNNLFHGGFVRQHVDVYSSATWNTTGHFSGLEDVAIVADGDDALSYAGFEGGVYVVYRNETDAEGKAQHNGEVLKFAGADAISGPSSGTDVFYSVEKVIGNEGYQNRIFVQGSANIIESKGTGFLGATGTLNFEGNFTSIGNETGNMTAGLIAPSGRVIDGGGNTGVDARDIIIYLDADQVYWNMAANQAYTLTGQSDTVFGIEAVAVNSFNAHATVIPYFNQSMNLRDVSQFYDIASDSFHAGATDISYTSFANGITVTITQSPGASFLSWPGGIENSPVTGRYLDLNMTVELNNTPFTHNLFVADPQSSWEGSSNPTVSMTENPLIPVIHGTNNDDDFTSLIPGASLPNYDENINLRQQQPGAYGVSIAPGLGNDNVTAGGGLFSSVKITYSGGNDVYDLLGGFRTRVVFDEDLTASDLTGTPSFIVNEQDHVTQIVFNINGAGRLELNAISSSFGLNDMLIEFSDGSGYFTVDENGVDFVEGVPPSPLTEQTGTTAADNLVASALVAQDIYALGGNDTIHSDGRGHNIYGGPGVDTYSFTVGQGTGFDTFHEFDTGNIIKLVGVTDPTQFAYVQDGNDLRVETGSGFIIKDYFSNPDLFQEVELDDGRIFQLADLVAGTVGNTGESYTVGDFDTIEGTPADDTFTLTGIFATVSGLAGHDVFHGNFGENNIDGGDGLDTLDYRMFANDQNVIASTGEGNAFILSPDETEIVGTDWFTGIEKLVTGDGNDSLGGSANDEIFDAGAGDDVVYTGGGNNLVIGGLGFDDYDGFDGIKDTLSYAHTTQGVEINPNFSNATGEEIDQDTFFAFEHFIGGSGDDTLWGGRWTNETLEGGAGNDSYVVFLTGKETTIVDNSGEDFEFANSIQLFGWSGTQTQDISLQDLRVAQDGNDLLLSHLTTGSTVRFQDGMNVQTVSSVIFRENGQFEGFSYAEMIAALDTGGIIGGEAPNEAPLAQDDSFTGTEDVAVTGNVLADNGNGADSDADGDPLTITPATLTTAQGGSVELLANGDFTYTPAADFNGQDSFTYTVTDGNGGSDTATVTLDITPVNDAPVAADDVFVMDEDTVLSGNLLVDNGNGADSDVDGDTLSVVAETLVTAKGGTVEILANGDFTYTPAENFNGADSFSYTLDDGNGGTAVGNVSLTVNPVNDAPLAADDAVTTDEDTATVVNVLSNDSDVDNDTLAISAVTDGANGTVTHDGTSVTYTPDANFFGTDSFTYTVSDGNGGFDTATVNVTVNPVNDNPVANDDTATTDQDTAVVIDVLANDTDVENDALSVFAANDGANGMVTHDGTSVTYTPNAGFSGADSFTYTVSDGNGGFDTATVNVTVNAAQTNTPPVANDDDFTVAHGNALTGNLLVDNGHGADSDADNDNLTVTAATIMTLAGATVTILANGDFTYEGATGFVGTDSFEYTLEDGKDGFDTAFANITVTAPQGAVVGTEGDDNISSGSGNDVIFLPGGNNDVSSGSGNDAIYAGSGDDQIAAGSGNDNITITGGNNSVQGGSGNDTVTTGDGDDVIDGGSGNDVIISSGGDNVITGGSGDDFLQTGFGNDLLIGGSGNDWLDGGAGVNTLTGGSGADTFVLGTLNAQNTITDFDTWDGDKLHLADLLTGFDPLADALSDFVQAAQNGNNTHISVDSDGTGAAFAMTEIAILENTGLDIDDLAAGGHLLIA